PMNGIVDLRNVLLQYPEAFRTTITEKLLFYADGKPVSGSRPTAETLVRARQVLHAAQTPRWSSLIAAIVRAKSPANGRVASQAQAPADAAAVFSAAQAAAGIRDVEKNGFGACSSCHAAGLTGRTGDPGERPALDSLPEDQQKMIRETYKGKVPPLAGPRF